MLEKDNKEKSSFEEHPTKQTIRTARIKMLVTLAMLSAMSLILATFVRIPIFPAAPFLNLDPKDVLIVIGGFIYGPLSAMAMSIVIAALEMPISGTGPYGAIMNALSSCVFACSAALIYKKWRTISGAAIGLAVGVAVTVPVMLLWNYLIVPLYMFPPDKVAEGRMFVQGMLLPVFMPFNLIKYGINSALALLLYKRVKFALTAARVLPESDFISEQSKKINLTVLLISLLIILICIFFIIALRMSWL